LGGLLFRVRRQQQIGAAFLLQQKLWGHPTPQQHQFQAGPSGPGF
jgi:hypothetical protein